MESRRLSVLVLILAGLLLFLAGAQPPPGVTAELVVETLPVYQKGSLAEPQIATVKLTLRADPITPQPLDVIIGIDRALNLDEARPFVERLINLLGPEDRIGLVSVAPANLDSPLTNDFNLVRQRLSQITGGGFAGLGDALALGTRELVEQGRPEARKLQIWFIARAGLDRTDFSPVISQAQRAKEAQIAVYTVAATDAAANSTTLLSLARLTNGILVKGLTDESLTTIQGRLRYEFVATKIVAKVTVTPKVTFEGAEGNPEIQEFGDGSKTLTWRLDALRPEEIYDFKFSVSSARKGQFPINRGPSVVEYTNMLGQRVRLNLPFITLDVPNASPVAKFEFNPELLVGDRATWQPVVNETIVFTDQSSDPDGQIVKWEWDFGDGTTSTDQNTMHAYVKAGEYTVRLTITDNEGATGSAEAVIKVVNIAHATRDLATFDGKLPRGIKIRVTLEIRLMRDVLGLGVREPWPAGWTAADVTEQVFEMSHGGRFKASSVEWTFPDRLPAGTVKKIAYEIEIPKEVTDPTTLERRPTPLGVYTLEGVVISRVPQLNVAIEGTSGFELIEGLEIRAAVAHFVVIDGDGRLDPNNDKLIDLGQALAAVAWWLEDQPVPGTGEKKIDLETMQEIIAYWLSNTPVDQPLPPRP